MPKSKKLYIALRKHNATVSLLGQERKIGLPEGCEGILFMFKTKIAARKFCGKDVKLVVAEDVIE